MRTSLRPLSVLLLAALAAPAPALLAQQPAAATPADRKKPPLPLPLAPARTIRFTTTKASWMSLDVSPDGRTIIFDLLGDLYTLPITGGTATRLTSGMAMDVQPRFSPDGKRVVFVSDRSGGDNLWLMSLDGKDTTQLTKGNDNLYVSPTFTPDGKYVIASKSGGLGGAAKLWMYDVDGGTGVPLIREPVQLKTLGAALSPDGRYVWYAERQGDWSYNAVLPQYQLAVYDRKTGTSTTMSERYGSAFRPAISHDGKWLVYGTRDETSTGLRLRNLQSGAEEWLAYPVQRDDQESRAPLDVLPGYAFTPDDKAIVVSYGGEIWRVPLDHGAPAKIPFTADVEVQAGPEVRFAYSVDDAPSFTAHQIRDIAPSPDGSKLAFSALDRVYVMDLPGGTPRRLTALDVHEHFPVWSPDGKSIVFATWDDRAGGQLYRASADGRGRPQQLTKQGALFEYPALSPDGKRIVVVVAAARDMQEAYGGLFGSGQGAQFAWVPAAGCAGGCDLRIIGPTGNRSHPHFVAKDSSRIYAYGPADGLVSFRWDGTDVRPVLKVTGPLPPRATLDDAPNGTDLPVPSTYELEQNPPPPPAALVLIAPTGDEALAQVGNELYAVPVPEVGGPTPTISVADTATAAFPFRKLTDIGGQFPAWSADGRTVQWAIGNAYVVYDLQRAKQFDDSVRTALRARSDSARAVLAKDTTHRVAYRPVERHVAITVQRDLPTGSAVLRGARVVTMKGDEVVENADVVVHDDRIVAVGPRGSVPVPPDARIVDVTGKTIVPGFVDTHYHSQWLIANVHSDQVWQYLATLAWGTTTTRDPQTSTTDVLTYEDQVDAGHMIGPRIYSTGPGVFSTETIKSLDDARHVLERYAEYYHTNTLKMYMTGNRQTRQWIIMAARELGLMPTTEGGLDYKLDLTHAIDGYSGIEHALPITPLYDDVVQLFNGVQVTNTPTLIVSYGGPFGENYWYTNTNVHDDPKVRHFHPEDELDGKTRRRGTGAGGSPGPGGWFMPSEYVFQKHAVFAKDLLEAGGRVGIGSHGQFQGLGYHWEMWMMASGGMSNHGVLRAATILGAQAIGMGKDLGSLEPGKLADLVVLDRNPLDDIRNTNTIRYVMKGGVLYDGNTLDELYPVQRKLPTYVWQSGGPTNTTGLAGGQ